jgi:hypothetical protein
LGGWLALDGNFNPMSDKEIEIIENNLLDLAIEGDGEAAQQYGNLYLFRRSWERTRSLESRQHLADRVQSARAWLTAIQ